MVSFEVVIAVCLVLGIYVSLLCHRQPADPFRFDVDISREWVLFFEWRNRASDFLGMCADRAGTPRPWRFSDLASGMGSHISQLGLVWASDGLTKEGDPHRTHMTYSIKSSR